MIPPSLQQIENSISLLRGRIYEAMDNRGLAADCFRRALQQDVYCFEAFDLLVSHHMMSAQEGVYCLHFTASSFEPR